MATVNVTNWAEFIEAIAVSGDTVVCPEDAVWDANDFAPNGITQDILWKCATVEGNGTIIRNAHFLGKIWANDTDIHYINDLHILDFIADGEAVSQRMFGGTYFMRGCKLSGILSNVYFGLVNSKNVSGEYAMDKCSVNLEFSCSSPVWLYSQPCDGFRYCRLQLKCANSTGLPYLGNMYYCEVIFYVSNASDRFYSQYYKGCTVRGNFQNVPLQDGTTGQWQGASSVYCIESFPASWTTAMANWFIPVTDAQLRDPQYLRSVGFPISIESGG